MIPAFNAQKWIAEALDSVANQTRLPEAIVVVNDGSVDDTVGVVQSWIAGASATVNVQLISQENQGIAGARNTAIRELDTELIALLDADDLWEPHHLARTCDALERNDDLVLCFADLQPFDQDGPRGERFLAGKNLFRLPGEERSGGLIVLHGAVFESLLAGNYVMPSTSVLRSDAIHDIGLFDPAMRVAEDYDIVLRLVHEGLFGYYDDVHAYHRRHEDNTSHMKHVLRMKEYGQAVRTKIMQQADELGLSRSERTALAGAARERGADLLYWASRSGAGDYGRCAWKCMKSGVWTPVFNPRDWIRSVAFSLGYGKWIDSR